MARADIHIFGSRSGYETLAASPRLREDEIRALAIFQFGEAATSDAIARLESVAVMSGRPLASGRFAISRMLPAGTDDAGRPTIEVISLIIDAAGYEACAGSLMMLAHDVDFWRSARAAVTTGIEIPDCAPPSTPSDPSLLGAYDLWFAAVRDGAIGVMRESESATILEFVCTLDPRDRAKCRWGIGLLSISTPADIASIDSGTSTRGVRNVIRPAQEGSWLCEKMDYVKFRARSTARYFVASDELLLAAHVPAEFGGFAQDARTVRVSVHGKDARAKSVTLVAIGSALLSTFVMALGVSAYAGMWKQRVVVMPPISPAIGDQDAYPTNEAASSRSKYGEKPPVVAEPAQDAVPVVTPPQPPLAAPPVDPQRTLPPVDPMTNDRDGDGTVDALDKCPDDKTLSEQIQYFADTDEDGKGDAGTSKSDCSKTPPTGYVDNSDDKCPGNKNKIVGGECGCDCDFDGVDADGDGQTDCLQKGPQGKFNRDVPGWKPDYVSAESINALGARLQKLASDALKIREALEQAVETAKLKNPSITLESYSGLLTSEFKKLNVVGARLFQLQKEQFERSKDATNTRSAHGFARRLWPAVNIEGPAGVPKVEQQWGVIVEDLIAIGEAIDAMRSYFRIAAAQAAETPTGSKSDRTARDLQKSVDRCFDDAQDELKTTSKVLLDRDRLNLELVDIGRHP